MSTKSSIDYSTNPPGTPGYHLYREMLEDDDAVYLELENCEFSCSAGDGNKNVTVKIPKDLAIELGLKKVK